MDSVVFEEKFTAGDIFEWGLLSDMHLKPHTPNLSAKAALDDCLKHKRKVYINGDILDLIVAKDPRYNKAEDKARTAGIINDQIEWAVDFLSPYADIIELIGLGNHEGSVITYHSFDAIRAIIRDIDRIKTNGIIHYGSYQGFITIRFKYANGKTAKPFQIIRHHGKGGSAPVTGGAIDLNRMFTNYRADLYWVAHKHKDTQRGEPLIECNRNGNVIVRNRRGIITPGFQSQIDLHDNNKNGGSYDFGDTFYGTNANGWAVLRIEPMVSGGELRLDWSVTMRD